MNRSGTQIDFGLGRQSALRTRRRAVSAAPAPRNRPTSPAVRTPSRRGPRVGLCRPGPWPRACQPAHPHTTRTRALPVAEPRRARAVATATHHAHTPGPSRPSHLACMRAIRPSQHPTHPSSLAFSRAPHRAAPPRPPSPRRRARQCALRSTAPARVQAP
jgi:hypothetical protein